MTKEDVGVTVERRMRGTRVCEGAGARMNCVKVTRERQYNTNCNVKVEPVPVRAT